MMEMEYLQDVTALTIGSVKMSLGGMAFVDYDKDGDLDMDMQQVEVLPVK